ncbi:MAG: hypothetical protein LBT00_02165 [Spirochaetaceae bacterium]|jgi:hypothetical protein|nr:hypothetical protein [Spirochaetaceae bacterium]
MKHIVVFLFCLFLGAAVYAQNVIITQGEGNFLSPSSKGGLDRGPTWFSGSIGTNILIYKALIQNDVLVNFGGIHANGLFKTDGTDDYEVKTSDEFLIHVSDNIFAALNIKTVGLRAGFFGGVGVYTGEPVQLFLTVGFLVGLHILPESFVSFTIDIKPGYSGTVHWDFANTDIFSAFTPLQHGWTFPLAVSVRLNLDRS